MVVFVDGFQSCGKTTLIDGCKYKHNRFPFNQYMDMFELSDINGFQLGKDLGILFALQYTKENVVFDRGPFSTVFYSLKENRYGDKTPELMTKFVSELKSFKNCAYVFVVKKNAPKDYFRFRGDGFDYLNDEDDPEKEGLLNAIVLQAKSLGIKIHLFENDFSEKVKQNLHRFNDLLEGLMNEHH